MEEANVNYSKKGSCFGLFIFFFLLFILLLIWVYNLKLYPIRDFTFICFLNIAKPS